MILLLFYGRLTLIFITVARFFEWDAEILYSFPLLFPVVPVKISEPKRKPWRASRPEIQKGFLIHLKCDVAIFADHKINNCVTNFM